MGRSEELIRRSDALKAIGQILEALWEIDIPSSTVPEYIEHHEGVQSVMKKARKLKEMLEKLPAVQPEPPWIPCSKKLPDYGHEVLVSLYDWVTVAHRISLMYGIEKEKDGWIDCDGGLLKLEDMYAWMPFPNPYKGSGDEGVGPE